MYAVLTADRLVEERAVLLQQVIVRASALGGDVSIYDGHDATAGSKVVTIVAAETVSKPINFSPPELLRNGLYVDVGSDITDVVVRWAVHSE